MWCGEGGTWRLVVLVAAALSYSSLAHAVMAEHWRLVVPAQAVLSYSSLVHAVQTLQQLLSLGLVTSPVADKYMDPLGQE